MILSMTLLATSIATPSADGGGFDWTAALAIATLLLSAGSTSLVVNLISGLRTRRRERAPRARVQAIKEAAETLALLMSGSPESRTVQAQMEAETRELARELALVNPFASQPTEAIDGTPAARRVRSSDEVERLIRQQRSVIVLYSIYASINGIFGAAFLFLLVSVVVFAGLSDGAWWPLISSGVISPAFFGFAVVEFRSVRAAMRKRAALTQELETLREPSTAIPTQ